MAEVDEKEVDTQEVDTPVDTKPAAPADDLAEYRNSDGDFDSEKIRKLAEDKKYYRQQISKLKQVPQKIEEYGKDFVLDSKFDEFMSKDENKEKIAKIFEKVDKMSLEKGIGVERNNDIRRLVLDELVANNVIDLTSAEKKEAEQARIVGERNKAVQDVIGDVSDIEAWNKNLFSWLKTFCNSDAEYEMHKKLAETNSLWALSLNKIRQAQMGNRIPVIHSDPKFNQEEWDRTFLKASKEEQDELKELGILQETINQLKELGVKVLSITDQYSVKANVEASVLSEPYGIEYIPGIEMDCLYNGYVVKVLGYNIDYKNNLYIQLENEHLKQVYMKAHPMSESKEED
mgnify:CR=1 FL=1